jgi:hypothetical protein
MFSSSAIRVASIAPYLGLWPIMMSELRVDGRAADSQSVPKLHAGPPMHGLTIRTLIRTVNLPEKEIEYGYPYRE